MYPLLEGHDDVDITRKFLLKLVETGYFEDVDKAAIIQEAIEVKDKVVYAVRVTGD